MRVTLRGLKRVGMKVNARWVGKQVYIWSREHGAYWREGGCGYTDDKRQAGHFDFEDAVNRTKHCGREKRIEYIAIPKAARRPPDAGGKE